MVNNEFLNNYLFHYNPYEKKWYAFERENTTVYFNDREKLKDNLFTALSSWEVRDLVIKHHLQTSRIHKG